MRISRFLGAAIVAGALAFAGMPAQATLFDTSLANGTYFGSGNPNTHWTVDESGNVELGLQASLPFVGPITPNTNVYSVATNTDWNFNFSIDAEAGGGTLYLVPPGTVQAFLSVKDLLTGQTHGFDPGLIPDNATRTNASGEVVGFQNSESFRFASIAGLWDPLYNATEDNTYIFTLSALDSTTGTTIDSTQMYVKVGKGFVPVPEPASLAIFGTMLLGLGFVVRRRRHSPSTFAAAA